MAKLDQYMQGRTEGMELALRIAKDKGIGKRSPLPAKNRNQPECDQAGAE